MYEFDLNERMMILVNFYDIINFLIKVIVFIILIIVEDVYMYFYKKNKLESIYLENFDIVKLYDFNVLKEWDEFFSFKDEVNLLLENVIKSGLIKRINEVKVIIKNFSEVIKGYDFK